MALVDKLEEEKKKARKCACFISHFFVCVIYYYLISTMIDQSNQIEINVPIIDEFHRETE